MINIDQEIKNRNSLKYVVLRNLYCTKHIVVNKANNNNKNHRKWNNLLFLKIQQSFHNGIHVSGVDEVNEMFINWNY